MGGQIARRIIVTDLELFLSGAVVMIIVFFAITSRARRSFWDVQRNATRRTWWKNYLDFQEPSWCRLWWDWLAHFSFFCITYGRRMLNRQRILLLASVFFETAVSFGKRPFSFLKSPHQSKVNYRIKLTQISVIWAPLAFMPVSTTAKRKFASSGRR